MRRRAPRGYTIIAGPDGFFHVHKYSGAICCLEWYPSREQAITAAWHHFKTLEILPGVGISQHTRNAAESEAKP